MDQKQFNMKKTASQTGLQDQQNRVRRQLEPRDKDRVTKQEKEKGFNVYLSGANEQRVEEQRKREQMFKAKPIVREPSSTRKKWGEPVSIQPASPKKVDLHPDAFLKKESDESYSDSFEEDASSGEEQQVEEYIRYAEPREIDLLKQSLTNVQDMISDPTIMSMIRRIRKLDDIQQHKLIGFLEEIEAQNKSPQKIEPKFSKQQVQAPSTFPEKVVQQSIEKFPDNFIEKSTRKEKPQEKTTEKSEERSSDLISEPATDRNRDLERSSVNPFERLGDNHIGKPKPVIHKHKRPYSGRKTADKEQEEKHEEKRENNELVLRIISTWGHAHLVGLTEIELFDIFQSKVELKPFMIEIKNAEVGNLSNPSRMIDGEYSTVDEKHMWLAPMPAPPANLEIVITVSSSIVLGGMRLWNYNKSFLDSVKGIRELEVLMNGNVAWFGIVNRGCGNKFDIYSTDIKLINEFEFVKNTVSSPMPEKIMNKKEVEEERPNSVPMWLAGHNPIVTKPPEKEEETKRPVQNSARLRPNPSQPIVPTFDKIVTKPIMKIDEDTNNLIKALNMKKNSFTSRDKKLIQTNFDKFEPFKVPEAESRKEEIKKTQQDKPEETKLDRRNSRRRLFQEPLKESLDSLEFFKITNENRIQREPARRLPGLESILPTIHSPNPMLPDFRKQLPSKETEASKQEQTKAIQDFKDTFTGLNLQDPIEKFLADEERKDTISVDSFKIPYFPKGKVIKISILSTWGDQHYVGLSGIELFDQFGTLIKFRDPKKWITADPSDVNILPGYGTDPRTVDKLLDGINWTCDDLHVWLAPFTAGQEHSITIDLGDAKSLSMMRIWNYNKSRIHSYRGAKDVIITFDEKQIIFKGEFSKAPGRMKDADQHCEYILFTKDEKILTRIEKSDWVQHHAQANSDEVEAELMSTIRLMNRPGTVSKHPLPLSKEPNSFLGEDGRPLTTAIMNPVSTKATASTRASSGLTGRHIRISLLETWGDSFYIGLTGIEVIGCEGIIRLDKSMIDANPRDMNVIPGYSGDYRTLDKLINGKNLTTDDHNMWLIPFTPGKPHFIAIDLLQKLPISALKFWNYNKNPEDTARGLKRISISIDGQHHGEVVIRKAPGNSDYDYAQMITLPCGGSSENIIPILGPAVFASNLVVQDSETPYLPIGYILKIRLFSTWGDMNYIGMNGLELYDLTGKPILRKPTNQCSISATPHSVREISGMENDVRTPDKLINGVNLTSDDRHMWLAPYQNSSSYYAGFGARKPNEIVLTFEKQICIGYIKFWNYGKTQARGVKEYEILLDDMIIYRGIMKPTHNSGDWACAVLFTGNSEVSGAVQSLVYRHEVSNRENVLMYNEGKLVGGAEEEAKVQMERPKTSVVIH